MAAYCCVALGPNNSHFLNSPTKWSMANLPTDVQNLFSTDPSVPGARAKEIHDMTLGPGGSFCVVYTKKQGGMAVLRSGLPAALDKWLVPVPGKGISAKRDLRSLCVVLGPNNSYFAQDDNGSAWSNLPPTLDSAIEQRRDAKGHFKSGGRPQSVALGPNGAYVLTTVGGGGAWDLKGEEDDVEKFLRESKSLKGVYVVLSPCVPGVHLVIFNTGGCAGRVPTSIFPQYEAFAADWKAGCIAAEQQANAAAERNRTRKNNTSSVAGLIGKALLKGALNAAINNNNGGGGGGTTYVTNNYDPNAGLDMSSFGHQSIARQAILFSDHLACCG